MRSQPWFRMWASETLRSADLDALTDHEFRVWVNLLCLASLEEPRWCLASDPVWLARQCRSSRDKIRQTLGHLESLGMVVVEGATLTIVHGEKYNEASRKPSDMPEVTRDRKRRERARHAEMSRDVTPLSRPGVTPYAREEAEAEREEEKEAEAAEAATAARDPLADRVQELAAAVGERSVDSEGWDAFRQICEEYDEAAVLEARRELRRQNKRPWPSNLRAVLLPKPAPSKPKRGSTGNAELDALIDRIAVNGPGKVVAEQEVAS